MFRIALLLIGLFTSSIVMSTVQEHTFFITGNNGEIGTGTFTWDDIDQPDGSALLYRDLLSIFIEITGGNVVGYKATFTEDDCTLAQLFDSPNFVEDINFWCDNGINSLSGVEAFENEFNDGSSILTFSPGTTSPAPLPPQLSIQSGFIKLDNIGEALPASSYCNDPGHYGRMVFAELTPALFICGPSGWTEFTPVMP